MDKDLFEHVGYVLIVDRGDGKCLVLGTANAKNRLSAINSWSPLEHHVASFATEHFQRIVEDLRRRFSAWSEDGFGLWFHVDASQLRAAVGDYDLQTGRRVRDGRFEVGHRVWVKDFGPGKIEGFDGKRALVSLERPRGDFEGCSTPTCLLKPIIRAAA